MNKRTTGDLFGATDCFEPKSSCHFIGAIISGITSVAGAAISASASKKAARLQADAADRATDLQRDIFDQNRADFAPFLRVGTGAIRELEKIFLGTNTAAADSRSAQIKSIEDQIKAQSDELDALQALPQGGFRGDRDNKVFDPNLGQETVARIASLKGSIARLTGDADRIRNQPIEQVDQGDRLGSFFKSPDFTFRQQEGEKAINRALNARGLVGADGISGPQGKALVKFSGDLASGEFNNFANRLFGLAGIGQSTAVQGAQSALQSGNQIGQSLLDAGTARASGVAGQANALNQGLSNVGFAAQNFFNQNRQNNLSAIAQADVSNPSLANIF